MATPPFDAPIVGERVELGPLRRDLYPLHAAWVNDPEVAWGVFGSNEPRTEAQETAWLDEHTARATNRFFLVTRRDEGRPIGVTSLTDIGQPRGTATFRILIGSPGDRGGGLGEEASRLVVRHAFVDLGVRRLLLHVFEYNEGARRLYARLGFREVERRRDRIHRDGRTWDLIVMALDRPPTGWGLYRPRRGSTVTGDLRVLRGLQGPWPGVPRDILVHLPAGAEASGRRYPVLYLHDGQNLFDERTSFSGEWRVDETLAALAEEGVELIAVGIPNAREGRGGEYLPYRARIHPAEAPYPSGLASDYVRFLVDVVKPAVDLAFPTRGHRAATGVLGSSWGALVSLWAAIERGDVFGLVGAMSPGISPGQEPVYRRLRGLSPVPDRVYVDTGDHEGSHAPTPAEDRRWSRDELRRSRMVRDALTASGLRARDRLRYVEEPGGIHHESAWARRLPDALRFLYGDSR